MSEATAREDDGHVPDTDLFARIGDDRACEALVRRYAWLVRVLASRYAGRGEQAEVLAQVAYVGLMKAIRRFDPARGIAFEVYARPTIVGELKRHFRDCRTWVKQPRTVQDLRPRVRDAERELTQRDGRTPSVTQIAARVGEDPERVRHARATTIFQPDSLDRPAALAPDTEVTETLGDRIPDDRDGLAAWMETETVRALLRRLPPGDRRILLLRFYAEMTQSDIAAQVGVSQMQVSRTLRRLLTGLRDDLSAE